MKKIIIMLALMLSFTTLSFATEDATDTGVLSIGTGSVALTVGISSGVSLRYVSPGDTPTNAQGYSIGAVHQGGNRAYVTAQDVNNIYFRDTLPGDEATAALGEIPVVADPLPGDPVLVTIDGVEVLQTPQAATWTNNGWLFL